MNFSCTEDLINLIDPTGPTDPTGLTDPTDPTGPTGPTDPTDPFIEDFCEDMILEDGMYVKDRLQMKQVMIF